MLDRMSRYGDWLRRSAGRLARLAFGGTDRATNLLLPPHCLICHSETDGKGRETTFCHDCRLAITEAEWKSCRRCGAAKHEAVDSCHWCRQHQLRFDWVIPLNRYEGTLRRAILRTKKSAGEALAIALARHWAVARRGELPEPLPDFVVATPMHWSRWLWRGANGAETMARTLAAELSIPLRRRIVVRRHNTLEQKDLSPASRFSNVRNAFAVRAGYDLRGARILLVDDVLTTGATCSEVARVLKQAGAAAVGVAVMARAEGFHS